MGLRHFCDDADENVALFSNKCMANNLTTLVVHFHHHGLQNFLKPGYVYCS